MCWDDFSVALDESIKAIKPRYFQINRFKAEPTWRERAYCYELYHQLRCHLGKEFPYTLHGEVDKRSHEFVCEKFNNTRPNPDFVVHDPGNNNKNLVVIEVKLSTRDEGAAQKDVDKLEKFINEIEYLHGIFLIFGSEGNVYELIDKLTINEELVSKGQFCILWHQTCGKLPEVVKGSFNCRANRYV